jgi:hypothetical protein
VEQRCSLTIPSGPFKPHKAACVTSLNAVQGVTLFRRKGWDHDVSTGEMIHHAEDLPSDRPSGDNSQGQGRRVAECQDKLTGCSAL